MKNFLLLLVCLQTLFARGERPNVLFICIDDLRPQLKCYGEEIMVTPNLDELAATGRLFRNHYVQVPTCGASRFALWSGRRPSKSGGIGNSAFGSLPKTETVAAHTLPQLLRKNGYYTASIGKVSHSPDGKVYPYGGDGNGPPEMPFSWDEYSMPLGKWGTGWDTFFAYADGTSRTQRQKEKRPWPPMEMHDGDDKSYPDGWIAEAAVARLAELKAQEKPFFYAVGFFKPHLPFNAPKKYWDLYDRSKIALSPAPVKPEGINPASWHSSGEMFKYAHTSDMPKLDLEHLRALRHAYFACVSYTDAQVGKLLTALDEQGLRENTIVVVWGDHGWHLGDQAVWGKHTIFDRALKSAFIVRTPGMKQPGIATEGLIESLDIYPSIAELCAAPAPPGLTGRSFVRLLDNPAIPGKNGAFGYWKNGGRTLRTGDWRITEYQKGRPAVELYHHTDDPYEMHNVAAKYPEQVQQLLKQLHADQPEYE
ncbi:MAG: arylsulfatase A-like enzyme [Kiritimatiellia bacterium]|jgi:arylsulfatase A-like enzyme